MLSLIPFRIGSSEPASDGQRLPLSGDDSDISSTPCELLRRFNPRLVGFGIADPEREQGDQESLKGSIKQCGNKEDKPE